jgi:lipopolysaccharide transport system permease protein
LWRKSEAFPMVLVRKKRRQEANGLPVVRVEATQGWGSLKLDELWRYQDLIYFMLWREIKGRYTQMALGPLWLVIQPLFAIFLNTIVFGVVAKMPSDGLPYPLFNYSAVLPWQFFSGALSRSAGSLVNNQNLITKVYFPRLVMPIVGTFSGIFDFMVAFGLLLIMMLIYQVTPNLAVLTTPLFLLLGAMTAMGVGLWLAALQARFRDVGFMLGYIIQAWMYATPVVYSSTVVPERWQFWYRLNPMTTVVEGFRWALLGSDSIQWIPALLSVVGVLVLLVSGTYVFRRTERTIVDIV